MNVDNHWSLRACRGMVSGCCSREYAAGSRPDEKPDSSGNLF
jgi:hypothetical protein